MLKNKISLKIIEKIHFYFLIIWILGILYACLTPNKDLPSVQLFPNADKVFHFIFYFGLIYLLLTYSLIKKWNSITLGIMILFSLSLGIAIEYLQKFMNGGRSFSVEDMLANSLGLLLGIIFYHFLEDNYKQIIKKLAIEINLKSHPNTKKQTNNK